MTSNRPVIIVGTPRSGTSLMQKLIRETPGFVSVPKESDMIWMPYCHPSLNDWQFEGCPHSRITNDVVADIRGAFATQALSAGTWRLFDRLGLMERPRLAACLRLGYRTLFKPWSRIREMTSQAESKPGRLVDKSVHAGLWLNLVDAVFPDARYVHMVRSPETCVPSMVQGWQSSRFQTYQVSGAVAPARIDTSGWWCFPMPADWHSHYHEDLVDICIFQWQAIHEAILDFLSRDAFTGRVLRVHLEDLSTNPDGTLGDIAKLIDDPAFRLHARGAALPRVNASGVGDNAVDRVMRQRILDHTGAVYERLRV